MMNGRTVEAVMRWLAKELGYEEEVDYWGIDKLLTMTLQAMAASEDTINENMEEQK